MGRKPPESPLSWQDVQAIMEAPMKIDARLEEITRLLLEDEDGDDGEEEADA